MENFLFQFNEIFGLAALFHFFDKVSKVNSHFPFLCHYATIRLNLTELLQFFFIQMCTLHLKSHCMCMVLHRQIIICHRCNNRSTMHLDIRHHRPAPCIHHINNQRCRHHLLTINPTRLLLVHRIKESTKINHPLHSTHHRYQTTNLQFSNKISNINNRPNTNLVNKHADH